VSGPTQVFAPLAETYARYRPGYPDALFEAIWDELSTPHPRTVDLGAGAGAATASLVARGARAVAVEPALAMLNRARAALAGRWVGGVAARAESLSFATGSLTLVTAAQAYHWFEARAALDEIARVLAPGGRLAVFWNVVLPDDFGREVHDLVNRWNPGCGRPVTQKMRATPPDLAAHESFDVDPPREFYHVRPMDVDRYVGYAFSWSYCGGALSSEQRAPFERELRAVVARHHGDRSWEERFVSVLHLALRRG
jgi:SAM-dependent methyltransferase